MKETRKPRAASVPSPGRPASAERIARRLGERIRELRRKKGMTLEGLSSACGVSRSMLSQIERQEANPTLAVTWRIAEAFGMSLDELIQAPAAGSVFHVLRRSDPTYHYRSDSRCTIRTLSPLHLEKEVEIYEVTIRPGGELRSRPHYRNTEEFLTVEEGKARVEARGESVEVATGDSVHYPADVDHAIVNAGPGRLRLHLVVKYQAR
jgi:transcriptional regulator with XRE-family HTH domain